MLQFDCRFIENIWLLLNYIGISQKSCHKFMRNSMVKHIVNHILDIEKIHRCFTVTNPIQIFVGGFQKCCQKNRKNVW
jgi:hypothetical protein